MDSFCPVLIDPLFLRARLKFLFAAVYQGESIVSLLDHARQRPLVFGEEGWGWGGGGG